MLRERERSERAGDLGRLLARLHAIAEIPPCDLAPFDPLTLAEARIRKANGVPGTLRESALRSTDRCRSALSELDFTLPGGVIHGDAYPGNVMRRDNEAVLIDFETFAVGPREWDLVALAVSRRRFGLARSAWSRFVDAYGFDVTSWPGYDALAEVRELMMTAWLMQLVDDRPAVLPELWTRLESIEEGDHGRTWQAF